MSRRCDMKAYPFSLVPWTDGYAFLWHGQLRLTYCFWKVINLSDLLEGSLAIEKNVTKPDPNWNCASQDLMRSGPWNSFILVDFGWFWRDTTWCEIWRVISKMIILGPWLKHKSTNFFSNHKYACWATFYGLHGVQPKYLRFFLRDPLLSANPW